MVNIANNSPPLEELGVVIWVKTWDENYCRFKTILFLGFFINAKGIML
jgi:hypothetical protein